MSNEEMDCSLTGTDCDVGLEEYLMGLLAEPEIDIDLKSWEEKEWVRFQIT